jgi:hypothetical protein
MISNEMHREKLTFKQAKLNGLSACGLPIRANLKIAADILQLFPQ